MSIRRQWVERRAMDRKSWNDSESEAESGNESELFLASPNFQHPRHFRRVNGDFCGEHLARNRAKVGFYLVVSSSLSSLL